MSGGRSRPKCKKNHGEHAHRFAPHCAKPAHIKSPAPFPVGMVSRTPFHRTNMGNRYFSVQVLPQTAQKGREWGVYRKVLTSGCQFPKAKIGSAELKESIEPGQDSLRSRWIFIQHGTGWGLSYFFERSEDHRMLRYTDYYGDGDSKAFDAVKDIYGKDSVTKLECIGHIQKELEQGFEN
ncbi:hypothetical protein TNCV_1327821 [Trichonephila clavipes]|nr:hypothetical protein TNCV_1327821 [Trichonephila clavipes]